MMKIKRPFIPPLLLAVIIIILVPLFVFITMDRLDRQKEFFISKLAERGTSLIRTFEAGTRSGMFTDHWGAKRIQAMLQETAYQPEVEYICIVSKQGMIVAHSDPAMVGLTFTEMPDVSVIHKDRFMALHRIVQADDDKQVFQVYKRFVPMRDRHRHKKRMPHAPKPPWQQHGKADKDWSHPYRKVPGKIKPGLPEHYVFAGLSMKRGQAVRARLFKETVFHSLVLFLLGCVGVTALFMFQAYKSAKVSLSNVKAFSDNVIQNMPSGLVTINADHEITSMNNAARNIFGHNLLKPSEKWIEIVKLIEQSGSIVSRDISFDDKQGNEIRLEVTGSLIKADENKAHEFLFLFRDLTQIFDLKRQVETNKRLAAIGKLAAGVAHEIRNPLSSIKGFATYFAKRFKDDQKDHETALIMKEEVERINRSITQLLEFAKPLGIEKRKTDIRELVDHSLKLVSHDIDRKKIQTKLDIQIQNDHVYVDPDRINQMLLNLYINAINALGENGSLEVALRELEQDGFIEIMVKDNGTGISPENIDRIFDPYFTTRSSGTGLGLSIVHRIVEKMGGHIRVESKEKQGTCFYITLCVQGNNLTGQQE